MNLEQNTLKKSPNLSISIMTLSSEAQTAADSKDMRDLVECTSEGTYVNIVDRGIADEVSE